MKKIFLILLIAILVFLGYYSYIYYIDNKEDDFNRDLKSKILIITDDKIKNKYIDDKIFETIDKNEKIPGFLIENLGFSISIDKNEKIVTVVNYDNLMRYYLEIDEKESLPIIFDKEIVFSSNDFFDLINIGFFINEETNTILYINNYDDYLKGRIIDNSYIYINEDETSMKIGKVKLDEMVFVENISEKWSKIITEDLTFGYILREKISDEEIYYSKIKNRDKEKINKSKINLTWEAVYSRNPNTSKIPEMIGLNTISPTWFSLKNSGGDINSKISKDYINWVKNRGYKLWPLVTNSFDLDMTHEFLNKTSSRMKFIDSMIKFSLENKFDGINIDFENVYLKDKDALSHFVAEFAYMMRKNNLTSSIDVTVIGGSDNWSKCFDRKKIGNYVDYMIIMAYDQYWASSPVSGPVAAYDWVDKKMAELVEVVKPNKLILGMPLYMRVWKETPSKEKANYMDNNSVAIGMEAFEKLLEDKKFDLIWDEVGRHNYVGYIEDNILKKIWVEDKNSIKEKMNLIKKYNLAGVATWRRGFETQDIWPIINEKLNY